ncbi:MAG: polyphosphate kinase 1 [Deltaproteobacteria bacterium]|nr:polyphosphate kinase 1 [Deltaproteobacteria bacterium]
METVVSSPVTSDQPAESSDLRWVPSEQLLNRELAWLRFNSRVLAIAEDEHTPLLERAKFLAIVGSNMDEFFMKRIGGLKLRIRMGIETLSADGLTPRQGLAACRPLISEITTRQSTCFTETLVPLLRDRGINFSAWSEIDAEMKKWCRAFFLESIDPVLTPLAVDASHPFPFISNLSLSLAVRLQEADGPTRFVRVKVPRNRARWVRLPDGVTYVPLEEVIANSIDLLFPGEELFGVHMFRVTRSIVVDTGDYQDDLYQDMGERPGQLRREIVDELRERRFAPAVRLEVDEEMPEDLRQWLLDQLHLLRDDLYQKSGPIGLADLVSLLDIDRPDLKYPAWRPRVHPRLKGLTTTGGGDGQANIFAMIRQGDLLLHHPFHDFDSSVLHFIRSAAEDPKVLAIKQTLYRTTRDSPVVHALVRAAECDKQVAVLVELKARLDENQNLRWAQVLESAGAHVSYGVEDLKTHTKIVLVVREEETGLRRYAHIGTGNYHPGTARLYTDMGLMTADPEVCEDVAHLFNMLTGYSRYGRYKKLLVAPKTMRKQFLGLIQREIEHARLGRKGEIVAKMNQLEDPKIIGKLYEASQAGVEVHLIVRGFCILRPGVPGLSDRIRVKSVVGRFLEHERLYMFGNAGKPEYYIGSADWMARNLSHRVEAIVRVDDPNCRAEIDKVLRVYLDDPYAWKMKPDGVYTRKTVVDGELPRGAQEVLMLLHADLDEE